jgi:two-component system chemotaxis sensor kinase CheA
LELRSTAELEKLREYHQILASKLFKSFSTFLDEGFGASMITIAEELGKPCPVFRVEGGDLLLSPDGEKALTAVFVHLLRNSLDHGIETVAERKTRGKDPIATIHIKLTAEPHRLLITYGDDGQGLNLLKLRDRGLSLGLVGSAESVDANDMANLIFRDGFSTRSVVTAISGRGVGLSAVRHYLKGEGGAIEVRLRQEIAPSSYNFVFDIRLGTKAFIQANKWLDTLEFAPQRYKATS